MEHKKIIKDGTHLLAGKIGTAIIGMINLMILARILTTEEMGKYSLFLMIVNVALIAGLNWSDSSIVRHGREEHTLNNKINKSFWARMYIFVPIIMIISTSLIIFNKQITEYIGLNNKYIFLIILLFIFNGLLNLINRLYQSTDEMKKAAYVLLSEKAIFLIILGIIIIGNKNSDLIKILILLNLSFLLSIIINSSFFDYKKILPYEFDKKYFHKIWKYSWPQLIGFPGLYIINYIDLYVIKKYLTLHDVGIYSLAYTGFTTISTTLMIINTVFFPLIVQYRTKKQPEKIKEYIHKIPLYVGTWSIMAVIGIIFSKFFITLIFSTKYLESVASFQILLIATIFYIIAICISPIVNAFDLIIPLQIFTIIRAIVNIIADFILVPKIGIIGAAYGTLLSYFIGALLSIGLLIYKKNKILKLE